MQLNRLYNTLNKSHISVENPKTGETKELSAKKIVAAIKEAIKKIVVVVAAVSTILTGALGFGLSEEISEFKNEKQYYHAVATVYADQQKAMKDAYSDSYQGKRMDTTKPEITSDIVELVDSQKLCEQAYPDKLLQFIFAPVIVDKCNDPDCEDCQHNRRVEEQVNAILEQMPEYSELISDREHYQERGK